MKTLPALVLALALGSCATGYSSIDDDATVARVAVHPERATSDPVVGRIQFRDRTIDMTVTALESPRDGVDLRTMEAAIMADVDVDHRSTNGDEELPR